MNINISVSAVAVGSSGQMCCTGLSPLCSDRACVCRSVFVHMHRWRSSLSSVLSTAEFLFRHPSRHHGDDVHILGLFVEF